jgi:aldehyde:ferredoxin oxidoreductase
MKGMFNKLLSINLSTKNICDEEISDSILENYLGGRGLAGKLFVDRVPVNLNPLSPDNLLIFATGPLTATSVPTSGRLALVTKSPLTNTIFFSNTGGFVGMVLKKCGYDSIVIDGKLEKPGYIVIDGKEGTQIKDAQELWGLDTRQTKEKLIELEGKNSRVLSIGPAGENQVLFSCIMNEGDHRAFGRGGVGAVMGSKLLKAIVVKNGVKKFDIHNQELLTKYVKTARDKIKVVPITRASLPMFGTAGLVNIINELGMLPINNFQIGFSDKADNVSGEEIREKILQSDEGCYACPIKCGRMTKAGDMEGKGPEYESVVLLGPTCGVFDLTAVTQANYMCNLYGLDTISAGATISCAMELQQKGLLKDDSLTFGNAEILKPILKKIAYKEGIGAELAEGSKRLAEKYGAPEVAMQVKGLEIPAYDPRGAMGHALGYATGNRGACHLTGYLAAMEIFAAPKKIPRFTTGGKPDLLVLKQHQSVIEDSLVVCKFVGWAVGFDFFTRFASTITGLDLNITKLMEIGERVYNLERLYNLREGISGKEDTLPKRFLEEPMKEGFTKDKIVPLDNLLEQYYRVRDWTKDGKPSAAKLKSLQLEEI